MADTKDIQTSQTQVSQEELKEVISDILRDGVVMNLATSKDGQPWAAALLYCYDPDFNIYWLSKENSRHSDEIEENSNVAVNITEVMESGKGRQLQITGTVSPSDNSEMAVKIEAKYHQRHKEFSGLSEEKLAEETRRFTLYELKPQKIWVTHEALWGYNRQEYTP